MSAASKDPLIGLISANPGAKWIALFCLALAAVWIVMAGVQPNHSAFGLDPSDISAARTPVRLVTYAFLQEPAVLVVTNIICLGFVCVLGCICLTPLGFIRLFSAGCIGSGAAYLLIGKSPAVLTGPQTGLAGMCAAFFVLAPPGARISATALRALLTLYAVPMVLLRVEQIDSASEIDVGSWLAAMAAGVVAGVAYGVAELAWRRRQAQAN